MHSCWDWSAKLMKDFVYFGVICAKLIDKLVFSRVVAQSWSWWHRWQGENFEHGDVVLCWWPRSSWCTSANSNFPQHKQCLVKFGCFRCSRWWLHKRGLAKWMRRLQLQFHLLRILTITPFGLIVEMHSPDMGKYCKRVNKIGLAFY